MDCDKAQTQIDDLTFSPGGDYIAASNSGSTWLYSSRTGELRGAFPGCSSPTFTVDGSGVLLLDHDVEVTGSKADEESGTCFVCIDPATGERLDEYGPLWQGGGAHDNHFDAAFDPTGRFLAIAREHLQRQRWPVPGLRGVERHSVG